jgi:hypothetical protein
MLSWSADIGLCSTLPFSFSTFPALSSQNPSLHWITSLDSFCTCTCSLRRPLALHDALSAPFSTLHSVQLHPNQLENLNPPRLHFALPWLYYGCIGMAPRREDNDSRLSYTVLMIVASASSGFLRTDEAWFRYVSQTGDIAKPPCKTSDRYS